MKSPMLQSVQEVLAIPYHFVVLICITPFLLIMTPFNAASRKLLKGALIAIPLAPVRLAGSILNLILVVLMVCFMFLTVTLGPIGACVATGLIIGTTISTFFAPSIVGPGTANAVALTLMITAVTGSAIYVLLTTLYLRKENDDE